jgi:phosphoribosylformimino-5-aminoimidazole carboxamide ribotide isomerase
VQALIDELQVPLQIGGGIRSLESARSLLDKGVDRIILGSLAMKNPEGILSLRTEYGEERLVIALDHRRGIVLYKGWQGSTGKPLKEALQQFTDLGLKWFLITDTDRDGTLNGPDTDTYLKLSEQASIIASGGVGSLKDLETLGGTGVKAVVVGKALYEGLFTLPDALSIVETSVC